MLRIGNYTVDITISLQDYEVAKLLGIENDDEQLEVAYDGIDWDGIEDRLGELTRSLIATEGAKVRQLVAGKDVPNDGGDADDDDAEAIVATDESDSKANGKSSVWCRFGIIGNHTRCIDVDDISPVLDEIAFDDLPEWGDEFLDGACDHGNELHRIAKRLGVIETGLLELYFDGIDEPAYEDYYDARAKQEGILYVER